MLAAAVLFPAACGRTSHEGGSEGRTSQILRARLAGTKAPAYAAGDASAAETWDGVRRLYAATGYQPVWLVEGHARPEIGTLRDAVQRAAADGLDPAEYDLSPADVLQAARGRGVFKKGDDEPRLDADIRLSYTFLKFAEHLERGRVPPGKVDEHWFGAQRDEDLAKALKVSLDSGKLGEDLERLKPQHPQYAALKKVLSRYRDVAAHGGWSTLPPDGRRDREVRHALNVPVEERIRQIELNLERWRWLPETLGDRYVLVNIPTYHLTAVENGRVALQMRVVTGKTDSPTPIFSDEMTTVVFSPYWNVPPDIARNETMPAAMRDPGYLGRNNLEVVRAGRVLDPWSVDWSRPGRVQFRQRPGAHNALGGVKFMFPNQFDVYLHDTPADALFGRVERDYSHGCVRLEKPFDMAQWVLRDRPEWTPEKIQAAMASGREQHVALKHHIPVYIVYETVWVDDDGTVEFREDVYGHDARQEKLIPANPAPGAFRVAQQAASGNPG
jgi:murein L,D-transpeptidase YcbB/YkuD